MTVKFLLKFNAAVIKEIPLSDTVTSLTIGRKEDNDIVIDHPAVSAHHARFFKVGSSYFIEDLNSTNGTFIKGKKILKAEIHNNDQIDIAKHSLIFVLEPATPVPTTESIEMPAQAPSIPLPTPPPSPTTAHIAVPPVSATVPSPLPIAPGVAPSVTTPAPVPTTAPVRPEIHLPAVGIEKTAYLSVIDGVVDETEIELSQHQVDYIGDAEAVKIKIKPGGIFGTSVGRVALICKQQQGYILKAIKEGYPKVKGKPIKDQTILSPGDVIEAGKTKMLFLLK